MKNRNRDLYDAAWLAAIFAVVYFLSAVVFASEAEAQTRAEIERQIVKSADANGVDPTLALAIAEVESQFNPSAVGSLGEIGLFQLRPEFHNVIKGDTVHNIDVAMRYLALLRYRCADYGDAFFVCYNYGTTRKLKRPTLFAYYKKVKAAQLRRVELNVAIRD